MTRLPEPHLVPPPPPAYGPRRIAARVFCACVLAVQLYFVVHAYRDPLKRFGFQPFSESTTWRVEIDSVERSGERHDISQGFAGYRWQTLVRERVGSPFAVHATSSGIAASRYFLQHALDYVADHTPLDRRTHYFEARVWFRKNRRAPQWLTLRSHFRDVP